MPTGTALGTTGLPLRRHAGGVRWSNGWRCPVGETVLDAGCGSGRVTEMLLSRLPRGRVVALDVSASMLAEARRRLAGAGRRVSFLELDLLDLGPRTSRRWRALDAVLSTATFHWVTDHDRLFANLASVLRPGGQLVAQCGAEGNIDDVIRAVRSLGVERAGTWLYASPEATTRRLEAAGFYRRRGLGPPEATRFPDEEGFVDFLETVCLREHVATLPPERRHAFAAEVAAVMAEP